MTSAELATRAVGAANRRLERRIGRVLTAGTVAGVALLAAGVVGMAAAGVSPLAGTAPRFDLAALPGDVAALRPSAFLWLGLLVLIATPSARVAASLVGFAASHDRRMTVIGASILAVIGLSVLLGRAGG